MQIKVTDPNNLVFSAFFYKIDESLFQLIVNATNKRGSWVDHYSSDMQRGTQELRLRHAENGEYDENTLEAEIVLIPENAEEKKFLRGHFLRYQHRVHQQNTVLYMDANRLLSATISGEYKHTPV